MSAQGARLASRYVELTTRYENGEFLSTSNSKFFGANKPSPRWKTMRVPDMENPHEMCALHCRRMAQRSDTVQPLPAPGTEIAAQQQRMTEDYEEQARFGRLYLDPSAGVYRPTLAGAYLMAWSQLQPMKALRRAEERRKTAAVLKELGPQPGSARVY